MGDRTQKLLLFKKKTSMSKKTLSESFSCALCILDHSAMIDAPQKGLGSSEMTRQEWNAFLAKHVALLVCNWPKRKGSENVNDVLKLEGLEVSEG